VEYSPIPAAAVQSPRYSASIGPRNGGSSWESNPPPPSRGQGTKVLKTPRVTRLCELPRLAAPPRDLLFPITIPNKHRKPLQKARKHQPGVRTRQTRPSLHARQQPPAFRDKNVFGNNPTGVGRPYAQVKPLEVRVIRATVIVTAAPARCLGRSRRGGAILSEEHAVGLAPNLREINFRCRRRNKPETVSCALLRSYRHVNGRGRLEEVAGELIVSIAESDNAPCHPAPLKVEGLDDCAHNVS
jgi:hypothetical protein